MVAGACAVSVACAAAKVDEGPIARALDAAADAVRDVVGLDVAVGDVRADAPPAPVPPTVDDVACDKEAGSFAVAEKTYPGRTRDDLARSLTVVVCYPNEQPAPGSGFRCIASGGFYVRDGAAGVFCGTKGSPETPTSARFISTL